MISERAMTTQSAEAAIAVMHAADVIVFYSGCGRFPDGRIVVVIIHGNGSAAQQ